MSGQVRFDSVQARALGARGLGVDCPVSTVSKWDGCAVVVRSAAESAHRLGSVA